jgi:hypothetical protein
MMLSFTTLLLVALSPVISLGVIYFIVNAVHSVGDHNFLNLLDK